MPTDKNKKEVKMRDLKPSKDAKGGVTHKAEATGGPRADGGGAGKGRADGKFGASPSGKKFGF